MNDPLKALRLAVKYEDQKREVNINNLLRFVEELTEQVLRLEARASILESRTNHTITERAIDKYLESEDL